MEFSEYATLASRTVNHNADNLIIGALGLAGESGEVCDHVKKHYGQGHHLDVAKIKNELGDVLWYIACTAGSLGLTLDEIAQGNIDKLKARYPEGFTPERSINRQDV